MLNIDLKSSVWFTLGSEDESTFCDTWNFFQLDWRSSVDNIKWLAVPIFSINFTNGKNPAKPNYSYRMSIKKSQAILKCFIDLKNSVWFTLGSEGKIENIGTAGHLVFSHLDRQSSWKKF